MLEASSFVLQRKVFLLRSFLPTAIGGGCACLFALLSIDVGRQALNRSFFFECRNAICTYYSAPEVAIRYAAQTEYYMYRLKHDCRQTPTDGDDLPRRPSRMRRIEWSATVEGFDSSLGYICDPCAMCRSECCKQPSHAAQDGQVRAVY